MWNGSCPSDGWRRHYVPPARYDPAVIDDRLVDFKRFEALTFDCYGTLIDWETGLTNAFLPIFRGRGVEPAADALLERFAVQEAAAEAGPYRRYRDVLAAALRGVTTDYGVEPTADEIEAFSGSVGDWPAFSDTTAALARLRERFRLGVITNCDDDLFGASLPRLGVAFDWVVTAQQVGAYKPSTRNFEVALERIGLPRDRILHVAQSLFHDHVPAKQVGLASAWINRRGDRPGAGATPPAEATPNATFPDMASFAAAATA
jgi:2-haloacid dehalogenase